MSKIDFTVHSERCTSLVYQEEIMEGCVIAHKKTSIMWTTGCNSLFRDKDIRKSSMNLCVLVAVNQATCLCRRTK